MVVKREVMSHDLPADIDPESDPQQTVAADQESKLAAEAQSTESPNLQELDLGSSLTIADVGEMHQRLEVFVNTGPGVRGLLCGGEVEQVDSAGIQLLAAVMKEALARQIEIGWRDASQVLCDAADQLGLGDVLRVKEAG